MCTTCGCSSTEEITYSSNIDGSQTMVIKHDEKINTDKNIIQLERDILSKNDHTANHNREHFNRHGLFAINLVSSPGSGKTTLLEKTLLHFNGNPKAYVIEGDQQTSNDAERIAKTGAPVIQINTGKACHLDAEMIHKALHQLKPDQEGILFIENVGNLVCPAMFDLGEEKRVVVISVTEGDDKPLKYPEMFHSSDLCIINKIDLLPYVPFSLEKTKEYAKRVNNRLEFIELSSLKGEGMNDWFEWLSKREKPVE